MSNFPLALPVVENALRERLCLKPLHRNIRSNQDRFSRMVTYQHVEVTYEDMPYDVFRKALAGLVVEQEVRAYVSRPYTHRAIFRNDHPDAAFRIEMRRYESQGIVRFLITYLPPKPEFVGPLQPGVQA